MDNQLNPLSKIPDLVRATYDYANSYWMWCIIFSFYVGSRLVLVFPCCSSYLDCGICITVATFKTAKQERYTGGYGRAAGGEHE